MNLIASTYLDAVQYASLRPYRLAVRTPGSHPGNQGSIPCRVTRQRLTHLIILIFGLVIDC